MPEQRILHAKDTINGKYGTAYAVIEGSRYELFYLVDIEAKVTQHKSTITRLGAYMDGHKVVGGEGKFTAKIRYITDIFRKMIHEANKTHRTVYFDLQITNDDPDTDAGRHSDVLKYCTLDETVLSKIDTNNTTLDETITGTFDDMISAEQFREY